MATNPSDSASGYGASNYAPGEIGLTKREYFAAQAFPVMCNYAQPYSDGSLKSIAEQAVKAADFLITALNKEQH